MIVRSEVRKFLVIFCGIDFTTATCMVSIPDENDRSLKITKKFFQVGHLYAVREQREEFFILTKHWTAVAGIKNRRAAVSVSRLMLHD